MTTTHDCCAFLNLLAEADCSKINLGSSELRYVTPQYEVYVNLFFKIFAFLVLSVNIVLFIRKIRKGMKIMIQGTIFSYLPDYLQVLCQVINI